MNEFTLTQLKIIIERTVRPVRASTARKRKMREELLAHVVGVFEEEGLGDERAALERTALRFGNPTEVTSQLQDSIPARDSVARFWEGRPGEATLSILLRLACVTSALPMVGIGAVLFAVGWGTGLPREAMITGAYAFLAMPVWLFGLAFLTNCIEKGVYDPAKVSRLNIALSAASTLPFLLLFLAGAGWPDPLLDRDRFGAVSSTAMLPAYSVVIAWGLAKAFAQRRRHHEEWSGLPIEPCS
jgi:hypothetical protein